MDGRQPGEESRHGTAVGAGRIVPLRRVQARAAARRFGRHLRPVHRAGRDAPVPGDPELQRAAAPPDEDVEAQGRSCAVRRRPPVLGGRQRLRPRVSHPPHRAAATGRLASAVHSGVAHPRDAARYVEAAVGVVLRRRARPCRRIAAALFRGDHQDAPLCDRRRLQRRSRRVAARPDAGAAADSAADRSMARRSGSAGRRTDVAQLRQQRAAAGARGRDVRAVASGNGQGDVESGRSAGAAPGADSAHAVQQDHHARIA